MTIILKTPTEVMKDVALRVKSKRLALNLTQEGAALRSGVSLGSLKRFESTGQISLESLLKLAHAVNSLSDFDDPSSSPTYKFSVTFVQYVSAITSTYIVHVFVNNCVLVTNPDRFSLLVNISVSTNLLFSLSIFSSLPIVMVAAT